MEMLQNNTNIYKPRNTQAIDYYRFHVKKDISAHLPLEKNHRFRRGIMWKCFKSRTAPLLGIQYTQKIENIFLIWPEAPKVKLRKHLMP